LGRLADRPDVPVLAPQFIAQCSSAIGPSYVGLFVSQSGETKDVLNTVEVAERREMGILGLVNVLGSTLMNESEKQIRGWRPTLTT
jgi:glucosamine 6-phosphate synthetase-like amidotransferase/phosphosugar isomerase protein